MLETSEGNLTDAQLAGFLCTLEAKGAFASGKVAEKQREIVESAQKLVQ